MRRAFVVALLALGLVTLAACGSSTDHGGSMHDGSVGGMHDGGGENRAVVPGARNIPVRADSLTFAPRELELAAGEEVTIVLTSVDIAHDLTVQGLGHVVHADAGTTERGGMRIDDPGTYRFWCSVDGHRAGGMVGTITVTA
jgi:plastocyanin